ncbi:Uncharacterised protein [Vibrio cholerae]|nr:Uncharacterised protein [Vibrio cholerae]
MIASRQLLALACSWIELFSIKDCLSPMVLSPE